MMKTLYAYHDVQSITHTPPCSPTVLVCERRALSQKRDGFETRQKVILSFGEPSQVHMGDSVPDVIQY